MNIQVGDILTMKKAHPCGEKRWLVLGVGEQLHLKCMGCTHEISVASVKIEKNIRSVLSKNDIPTV